MAAHQVLLGGRPRAGQEPADLQLEEDRAHGHERRGLLQGPSVSTFQALGQEPVRDAGDADVAHVHPLVQDQLGQEPEGPREQGKLHGELDGAHAGSTRGGHQGPPGPGTDGRGMWVAQMQAMLSAARGPFKHLGRASNAPRPKG